MLARLKSFWSGNTPVTPNMCATEGITPILPQPGVYRHYKGNDYLLLYVARHSETRELLVVYQALYGEHGIWVRPLAMWGESVLCNGASVPRFTYMCATQADIPR